MCTHLYRREGGTYYFRRAIPASERSRFDGKREWIESLRTKDRVEAKRLIPAYVQAFDRAMMDAKAPGDQSSPLKDRAGPSGACEGRQFITGAKSPPLACVSLLETFEEYVREQGVKAVTANEWRGNLKALVRHVGHDDAARLTVDDIDDWRDVLLSEKTKRGGLRSARTVKNGYIAALRSTLNYAIGKRKISKNVAASVVVRIPKTAKLRDRDFTNDEVKAILAATLKGCGTSSKFMQRSRRWIPWLCAYTGARVNEISQLRGCDVAEIDGVWTIRITPEAGTVKSGEARLVPLHPHLIQQGFLQLVESAGDAPIFYDPTRVLKPGPANRHVKKVGEQLAMWVRADIGITDPGVQPNHGWRHLFKSRAMQAGIPERVADAIQGHAPRSVGQAYGVVPLDAKARAIASMPRFIL